MLKGERAGERNIILGAFLYLVIVSFQNPTVYRKEYSGPECTGSVVEREIGSDHCSFITGAEPMGEKYVCSGGEVKHYTCASISNCWDFAETGGTGCGVVSTWKIGSCETESMGSSKTSCGAGLDAGAIFGIVFGSLVGVCFFGIVIPFFFISAVVVFVFAWKQKTKQAREFLGTGNKVKGIKTDESKEFTGVVSSKVLKESLQPPMNEQEYELNSKGEKVSAPQSSMEHSKLESESSVPEEQEYDEKPPANFLCPISGDIMKDPHILVGSSQTYEKEHILIWLAQNDTDPITRTKLRSIQVIPNIALRGSITEWKEKHFREKKPEDFMYL